MRRPGAVSDDNPAEHMEEVLWPEPVVIELRFWEIANGEEHRSRYGPPGLELGLIHTPYVEPTIVLVVGFQELRIEVDSSIERRSIRCHVPLHGVHVVGEDQWASSIDGGSECTQKFRTARRIAHRIVNVADEFQKYCICDTSAHTDPPASRLP